MKCGWVVVGMLVCAGARASFELMYIPSVNTDRVIRYDPLNRVQLGGIVNESASSVAYAGGQFGIIRSSSVGNVRYNMHSQVPTLMMPGSLPAGMSADGNTVLSLNGNLMTLNTLSTGSSSTLTVAGIITPMALVRLASGSFAGFGFTGTSLYHTRISASGGSVSSSAVISGNARVANSAAILTTDSDGNVWVRCLVRTATNQVILSSRIDANGFVQESSELFISGVSTAQTAMLAPGHLGFYVVGADSTTETITRFRHYVGGAPVLMNTWTENFDSRNTFSTLSMGMVVAPEPGTMVALGGAVAWFLRRRSRRSVIDWPLTRWNSSDSGTGLNSLT